MSSYDIAIKKIQKNLKNLPFDQFNAVQATAFDRIVPGWQNFQKPAAILSKSPSTDVGCEVDSSNLLGSYRPLSSPGVVTLYFDNLQIFYWSVVREMDRRQPGFSYFKQDLEFLASFIVAKTWHHELFHHSIEVLRQLVRGVKFDPEEEALAVAYARQSLRAAKWSSQIARMGKVMFNLAMEIAFDGYPAPYSNWTKYDSPERLNKGIVDLLKPSGRILLESSNVPVGDILASLIPIEYGYVDQVI